MPMLVPFARSSTWRTVPSGSLASALTFTVAPSTNDAPSTGAVMATVGGRLGVGSTATAIAADVTTAAESSVARATSVYGPATVGVQVTSYGAVASTPTTAPLASHSTCATSPSASLAVARRVTGVPTTELLPAAGAVSATVGGRFGSG